MQVATILAQSNMDLPSVTAGLLHDTSQKTRARPGWRGGSTLARGRLSLR